MTKKNLSPEDLELWFAAVHNVRPLSVEKRDMGRARVPLSPQPPSVRARRAQGEAPFFFDEPGHRSLPAPSLADHRTRSKMWKGRLCLDARLDLHGVTLEVAEVRFRRFLHGAIQRGDRWVLVITGKGPDGNGILRRALPQWLEDATIRPAVVSYMPAPPHQGGEGAVCLLLRRL